MMPFAAPFIRPFMELKGQVTFLKLCLLVVCLALIIYKMHLYACASVVFFCQRRPVYAGTAIEVMFFWL